MDQNTLAKREVGRLIGSDKVEGTAVHDRQGVKIGTIERVMIDKYTGQVAYAVMSFGGFLGIGEAYHPLPWRVLDYDPAQDAYVVDIDRRTLEGAPAFARDADVNWTDEAWNRRIYDYYRMTPYWE